MNKQIIICENIIISNKQHYSESPDGFMSFAFLEFNMDQQLMELSVLPNYICNGKLLYES